jgi:hypothetical protein
MPNAAAVAAPLFTAKPWTLFDMSRAAWYRQLSAGKIGPAPARVGKKRLYSLAELAAWAEHRTPGGEFIGRKEWQAIRAAAKK